MKNHDSQKLEFQELFLTEYRYNDWFDIQIFRMRKNWMIKH